MTLQFLVVDDEPDVQSLIERRFRSQIRAGEFEFTFAHDGEEALKLIEMDSGIDIALIDINMPRMDGLTLLNHLRNNSYVMKFIVLSGNDDMENIRSAMNSGAFDFVPKPINFDDLMKTIEKSMDELAFLKDRISRRNKAENEQKIIPMPSSFSLNVVATETLSNTASTATPANRFCSPSGIPSFS